MKKVEYEQPSIPLSIVKAGKTKEYVALIKIRDDARGELYETSNKLRGLYEQMKDLVVYKGNGWTKTYFHEKNSEFWAEALHIQELSKEIVETAGRLAELNNRYRLAEKEINGMEC